jgi:hypothetical protein
MITPYSNIISVTTLEALLLDTYSGAAAAYSLRRLSATYTGSAIRVRIDTAGNPEYNIGFVNNELDVATLEGYCTGGLNAYVITWYDQSGNANDATQATSANQPQIVSSGSVILDNGKPSVEFDGVNTFFDFSYTATAQPIYIFSVAKLNWTFPKASVILGPNQFDDKPLVMGRRGSSGNWILFAGTVLVSGAGDNLQNLHSVYANSTNSFYYLNGSQILNGNAGDGYKIDYIGRSGDENQDGKTQEIIIYNSNESSNRTGIETNINDFYSIY